VLEYAARGYKKPLVNLKEWNVLYEQSESGRELQIFGRAVWNEQEL